MSEFRPAPLVISRVLRASPDLVYRAWSDAEFVKRWFPPETCSAPEATVDFRPGGAFNLTMQLPDGTQHHMRATFTKLEPSRFIGFAGELRSGGKVGFRFETEVTIAPEFGGARLQVTQRYESLDDAFRFAIQGAREGWGSTLGNLEREALALPHASSTTHGAFTVRRSLAAALSDVYRAFADPERKARWFTGPEGFQLIERVMDVRPSGRERLEGRHASGVVTAFDAVYFDVIPNARLVYAYEMRLDGRKISVSLVTVTFEPDAEGTVLTVTEQGAFLDGYDDSGARETGTRWLLDAVERSLSAD